MYTDETILTKGKFKFTALCRVPPTYLLQIYKKKNKSNPELYEYVVNNLPLIEGRLNGTIEIPEFSLECKKIVYNSEKVAKIELSRIRNLTQHHKKPVRVYACSNCGGYHLTSMPIELYRKGK